MKITPKTFKSVTKVTRNEANGAYDLHLSNGQIIHMKRSIVGTIFVVDNETVATEISDVTVNWWNANYNSVLSKFLTF